MHYPKKFQNLIAQFSALPSIGPKMAERLVLYLFKQDEQKLLAFAEALEDLHHLRSCDRCFYISESALCEICSDTSRDQTTICVVEEPLDVIAIERTGSFRGLYHVLGGVMDMSREQEGSSLRIAELVARVTEDEVEEVILATNPTTGRGRRYRTLCPEEARGIACQSHPDRARSGDGWRYRICR